MIYLLNCEHANCSSRRGLSWLWLNRNLLIDEEFINYDRINLSVCSDFGVRKSINFNAILSCLNEFYCQFDLANKKSSTS